MDRAIIHLNVTDFAVAVERIRDSSLRQVPLIVATGEAGKGRTLVFDMSEEAYQEGVRKGMQLNLARKYCNRAKVITPCPALYRRAMAALVKRVAYYTPLVEQGEEDGHLFLDVTGTHRLFGPAPDVAWRLRKQLLDELGLDPVWSLASNKLVSKVASRVVRPFGEYIVSVGEEDTFLAPLPLSMLPGVTAEEIRLLEDFNVRRIGQLAELSRKQLLVVSRTRNGVLHDASRGRDITAVLPGITKDDQITEEHVFEEDTARYGEVQAVLTQLVHGIARVLRQRRLLGQRVGICLVYGDGKKTSRQVSRKGGSDSDFILRRMALTALDRAWGRRIRIRSCVLICDRLLPRTQQQTLFVMQSEREQQEEKIMSAMDMVRSRFGAGRLYLGTSS
ncbi:nucleotidyltransferase/DNA polymerase involved in DNA repair [Desulfocapsa sulfexigens DSM 10523]|uniref:Nucleotidyltransferase/DNA polymerase involved in DNA repair n=1 Tax=Desulfocapsa sulfexigens (strain DSM 10523 / SB164P1) TaxID=1167006 RepID=M1NFF5_DESSD|nr:nucleotidyltransferase/DNA polymerase involved in DNA repair [Desulfocapsa sulfexigens]AGF78394.1 nucleotidyltransferase/DNA polymerase involved in DNA repair [Desulfocapsa sulfexigens DSM 10523]